VGESYSDSDQTVLELLNRFGADGWELAGLRDCRWGGKGSNYWGAARLLTAYTFKTSHPRYGSAWLGLRGEAVDPVGKFAGATRKEGSERPDLGR
jgi:hypothetical protein